VSLEVALKVHGSKVMEVRGAAPRTEPFEEETSSMIVFPHGGVLRMSTAVNAGQMLVLTNLKSRQDAICRVVKVRSYSSSSSYVEVEFTHRQPGFWGVYFESDAIAAATPPAPALSPAAEPSSPLNRQPGPGAPSLKDQQGKNASPFIAIGSQEDVQPAASSTSAAGLSKPLTPGQEARSFQKPASASGSLPPASAGSTPSAHIRSAKTQQEEEDASLASEPLGEPSSTARLTSTAHGAPSLTGNAFGSRLDQAQSEQSASEGGKKNWLLIAACGAILLAIVGGGAFLMQHKSQETSPARTQVPAPVAVPNPAGQNTTPQVAVETSPLNSNPASLPPVATRPAPAPAAKTVRDSVVITESVAPPGPAPISQPAAAKRAVPNLASALNAHPVAPRQRHEGIAAPTLDAVGTPSADPLAAITSSSAPTAPAVPASSNLRVSAPVQLGSGAKEPRLLVRVIPQYPPMARQTHTEGDVALQITVDTMGNVTDAKVLSGPTVLHMAAVGAVKRWKYEPFDGQSAPAKMTVTIQFRL
jgi:protein TonB